MVAILKLLREMMLAKMRYPLRSEMESKEGFSSSCSLGWLSLLERW